MTWNPPWLVILTCCVLGAGLGLSACAAQEAEAPGPEEVVIHFESEAHDLGNLVAFYPFWSSADDTSGLANHGVLQGGSYVTDRFGSARSALELDGVDEHLVLAQQVIGTDLGDATLSLWFRTTQASDGTLFFEGEQGGRGLWVKIQPGKDRIRARAKKAFTLDAEGAYNDGRWHHLVLRTESTAMVTLFLDGAVVGFTEFEADYEGPEFLPITPVIGRSGEIGVEEPGAYFEGTLDDVAVFRGALANEDITTLLRDGPNRVPIAVVDGPRTLFVPDVAFDASNSWDDDGMVVTWDWDFGTGTVHNGGPMISHSFPDYGTYTVTVTVTDDEGGQDTATTGVVLRDPACPYLTCDEEDLWDPQWIALELGVLAEVNKHRAQGAVCGGVPMAAVPPLEMNEICRAAARLHALDMGVQAYFEHEGLDGSTPSDRMTRAGFEGAGPWGENIAAGDTTAEEVVESWMTSPGHCTNIMDPDYGVLGVGYAFVLGSPWARYWVQTFAGGH